MAKQLPKLNQNQPNSKETNLVAIIDDDSLKKIVSADKKAFSNTVSKNTVKITTPLQNFFQTYKEETLDAFFKISDTLIDIWWMIVKNNETLKDYFYDNKRIHENKERKEKKSEAEKREEKREENTKKRVETFSDKAGKLMPYVTDPSKLQDAAWGHFLGTSIGAAITKIIGNPFAILSSALKTNPALVIAIPAIAQELANTRNETDQISDPRANNSDFANKTARFLHGDVNKNDNNTLLHYLKMMGIGGAIGAKGGGIWGGILGALGGGVGAYATDKMGPEALASYVQLSIDQLNGFFQIFTKSENLENIIGPKIEQAKQLIYDHETKMSENIHNLLELEKAKNEAFAAGDEKRVSEIQYAIDKLNEENSKLVMSTDALKFRVDEYTEQLLVNKKEGIIDRIATWFGQVPIIPGTDLEFRDLFNSILKKEFLKSTLNITKWLLTPLVSLSEEFSKISLSYIKDIFEIMLRPYKWVYEKIIPLVDKIKDFINDPLNSKALFGKIDTPEFSNEQIQSTGQDMGNLKNWFDRKWQGLVDFLGGDTTIKDYNTLNKTFPGKEADDKNTRYLNLNEITKPVSSLLSNGIPEIAPVPNLLTEIVKQKTLTITELAKSKNESESGSIGKMLAGMVNNIVTNNSSVNNTSISKQTILTRQNMAHNTTFTGYGRGE